MLRKKGVVDKFVEFFGDGLANLPLADRATIAQHGAGIRQHLRHLPDRRRNAALSRAHRPQRRADRAGEGVRAAPGHVARERPAAGRLHRCARARSRHRRAFARGPEASAGSRAAAHREADLSVTTHKKMAEERTTKNPTREAASANATVDGKSFEVARRRGADRRDHELHEHVESRRADRRRPARPQCAQARPDCEALGEDQPRAGLARRHRLSQQGRSQHGPRSARLLHRRLRLHDVHRQLRSAEAGDLRSRERRRCRSPAPCSPAIATSKAACIRK